MNHVSHLAGHEQLDRTLTAAHQREQNQIVGFNQQPQQPYGGGGKHYPRFDKLRQESDAAIPRWLDVPTTIGSNTSFATAVGRTVSIDPDKVQRAQAILTVEHKEPVAQRQALVNPPHTSGSSTSFATG